MYINKDLLSESVVIQVTKQNRQLKVSRDIHSLLTDNKILRILLITIYGGGGRGGEK